MFIPKELLQAIVFATIIGISIVIGFAIYSPKTSFDACIDRYIENEISKTYFWRDGERVDYSKEALKSRANPDRYKHSAFSSCKGLR